MEHFEELIKDFGRLLNVPLHLDKNKSCLLNINDSLKVQIEYAEKKEAVLIASHIAELPAGKFRETVLKDALRANNEFPKFGILAYSSRNNQLSLFFLIPQEVVTPAKIEAAFLELVQKAENWKAAIDSGQTYTLLNTASLTPANPLIK